MSRTLVVLGGGGALGAFQAGSLLALMEAGVRPHGIFGCSAGALNAAFLADDPTAERARQLAAWWTADTSRLLLSPPLRSRLRGVVAFARSGGAALLDAQALRSVIAAEVAAARLADLQVPLTITTTCLDCCRAVHHDDGPLADLLVATCALPGLFPPVVLAGGHSHVDGGVVCGVPLDAAVAAAGPDDRILVLDCGLAPVTSGPGCAAGGGPSLAGGSCGLPVLEPRSYRAPVERSRGAVDVVLRAFTAARAVASSHAVRPHLDDPRVHVMPHVADAWSAGLIATLPRGPRDLSGAQDLVGAGLAAAQAWLQAGRLSRSS